MNNSPFDKAVAEKAQHHCESCRHFRQRRPDDVKVEAGHEHDTHWCEKLSCPTVPLACRCGGDDWESRPTPQERRAALDDLGKQFDALLARHGSFVATEFLIGELVKLQSKSTISKADYQGDNFRVTVTVKKRR